MGEEKTLEERVTDLEGFVNDVHSGRRVLLFLGSSVVGVVTVIYMGINIWKMIHG